MLKATAKELKEQSAGLSIVYAEDEVELRESVTRILERFFHEVHSVQNGQEAFQILKSKSIDIVLTDINMPIMDGLELIRSLNNSDMSPKIVVLTAFNNARMLEGLINMNINHFIAKPLDKEQLINALYNVALRINEEKIIKQYEQDLENENIEIRRKNEVLTQKLNQLAHKTNQVIALEAKANQEKNELSTLPTDDFYKSLLRDDVEELQELLADLDYFLTSLFFNQINTSPNEIHKLSDIFRKFASVLNSYQEFYEVSIAIVTLSNSLDNPQVDIAEHSERIALLLESLLFTIHTFRDNVFEKHIDNPSFYNASLLADIEMINNVLLNNEVDNSIEFF